MPQSQWYSRRLQRQLLRTSVTDYSKIQNQTETAAGPDREKVAGDKEDGHHAEQEAAEDESGGHAKKPDDEEGEDQAHEKDEHHSEGKARR